MRLLYCAYDVAARLPAVSMDAPRCDEAARRHVNWHGGRAPAQSAHWDAAACRLRGFLLSICSAFKGVLRHALMIVERASFTPGVSVIATEPIASAYRFAAHHALPFRPDLLEPTQGTSPKNLTGFQSAVNSGRTEEE